MSVKEKVLLNNAKEVKSWLRGLVYRKKELGLKLDFYKELYNNFNNADKFSDISNTNSMAISIKHYKDEIQNIEKEIKTLLEDMKKMFNLLDEDERLVLTARYINNIKWDFIELKVYFSRRQAIRIHDRAIEKLVGCEISAPGTAKATPKANIKKISNNINTDKSSTGKSTAKTDKAADNKKQKDINLKNQKEDLYVEYTKGTRCAG